MTRKTTASTPTAAKKTLAFYDNTVTGTGANAMLVERHAGEVDITGNTLDAGVNGGDAVFVMTYGGTDVTLLQNVSDNVIDLGTGSFDYDHRATGVTFASAYDGTEGTFANVEINGNTFENVAAYRRADQFVEQRPG